MKISNNLKQHNFEVFKDVSLQYILSYTYSHPWVDVTWFLMNCINHQNITQLCVHTWGKNTLLRPQVGPKDNLVKPRDVP